VGALPLFWRDADIPWSVVPVELFIPVCQLPPVSNIKRKLLERGNPALSSNLEVQRLTKSSEDVANSVHRLEMTHTCPLVSPHPPKKAKSWDICDGRAKENALYPCRRRFFENRHGQLTQRLERGPYVKLVHTYSKIISV
jgi:hypothetical protein